MRGLPRAVAAGKPIWSRRMRRVAVVALSLLLARSATGQIVPEAAPPAEAIETTLRAEWMVGEERKDFRVDHGVWDDRDLDTPLRRAQAALIAWSLADPALADPSVPAALRAEALLRRGRAKEALDLLGAADDPASLAVRTAACLQLGKPAEAIAAAAKLHPLLDPGAATSGQAIVAAARAAVLRGQLEPTSTASWQRILNALGRARTEFDRLDWQANLVEGSLLADKHHEETAVPALAATLSLNPRASEAWYRLGLLAADRFDFDSAERAARMLERIHAGHPLAALLRAEAALIRRDPDLAAEVLDRLLAAEPAMPAALALRAAADATRYDDAGCKRWLATFDQVAPGSSLGLFTVGRHLGDDRQYDEAAAYLDQAIARQPEWSAPRIVLGMLETQTARDAKARAVLEDATRRDPFDKRAQFSLFLLDELAKHSTIESKHFVIRYAPGEDEVVARMMPDALDAMHEVVCARFGHEPPTKTLIDLMPDHRSFAVRITGMPQLHTIAACTGPMIAIEVPRVGAPQQHLGTFDWLKVLRHEYTHTVTLSQTRNRIPHWLTEAAAVSMEFAPRDYATCQMLARELEAGTLFDLDSINWGFIRPKRPQDRGLAYAQGHWMVEFMNERYGESALPRLLGMYHEGVPESEAMQRVLGTSRKDFHAAFLAWAKQEVKAWGLAPTPTVDDLLAQARDADPEAKARYDEANGEALKQTAERLAAQIGAIGDRQRDAMVGREWPRPRGAGTEVGEDLIATWLTAHPDHPDILELAIRRRIKAAGGQPLDEPTIELLDRYAKARPVDPFPHRQLAKMWLAAGDGGKAVPHLAALDILEQKDNSFAIELARAYRELGEPGKALVSIDRAARMNPYDPAVRELAAAIAVEAGDLEAARTSIQALLVLEPDRPQHRRRLERIEELLRANQR